MRLGAHGPGFSVASACATGGHALGEALRMIQRGEADVVVAGGTEAALIGVCLAAFAQMGALSKRGVSCPFDKNRDGFVMGEGAAVLVLERADHARARGATCTGGWWATAPPTTPSTSPSPTRTAGARRRCAPRSRTRARRRRRRLHQRPRHLDPLQRPDRDQGDPRRLERGRAAGVLHQVGDRPPPGRGRRRGGDRDAGSRRARGAPAHAELRGARPGVRSRLRRPKAPERRGGGARRSRTRSGSAGRTPCLAFSRA